MGKLLKAGADARHFLSQFRSMVKMAELVSDLSGLESEANIFEKRKVDAEVGLSKLNEKSEFLNEQFEEVTSSLKALQLKYTEDKASFDTWAQGAKSSKERIIEDTSRLQKALNELRAKLL